MHNSKTKALLSVLLLLMLTTTSAASLNNSVQLSSFGTIKYWDYYFQVGFENSVDDFKRGIEHTGDYVYWDRGGYWPSVYPEAYRFEPNTEIVHSGSQSALLELLDPTSDGKRRNMVYHDVDPLTTEHIWQIEYFYLPADFPWTNPTTGEPFWYTLQTLISERMWNQDLRLHFHEHGIKLGVLWHRYRSNPVFVFTRGPSDFDNDNDGQWDTTGKADQYFELGPEGVPKETWIQITSHVYRNLDDWDQGYVEFWISDESTGETIYHKQDPCLTIGINPESIAALPPSNDGDGNVAWLTTGFDLYTGGLDGGWALPTKLYVDDFFLGVSCID